MPSATLPILVFAQSGRFISQSANQAGYRVWLADCFCDVDTVHVAERHIRLPPLSQLSCQQLLRYLVELSAGESCLLVCGSGIEQFAEILQQLPPHIELLGNPATTIKQIKTPRSFFELLTRLELPYPKTQFNPPSEQHHWLFKPAAGCGGIGIHFADKHAATEPGYYQHYIAGIAASALFISDGDNTQLLAINQQYCSYQQQQPFCLQQIDSPFKLSGLLHSELHDAIRKLVNATGLVGINSIDFMIDRQQQLWLLEVNPRLSASAELLQSIKPLFSYHYTACREGLSEVAIAPAPVHQRLVYLFADKAYRVPAQMSWPSQCRDIPHPGTHIKNGDPICSLLLRADICEALDVTQQKLSQKITENLHSLS